MYKYFFPTLQYFTREERAVLPSLSVFMWYIFSENSFGLLTKLKSQISSKKNWKFEVDKVTKSFLILRFPKSIPKLKYFWSIFDLNVKELLYFDLGIWWIMNLYQKTNNVQNLNCLWCQCKNAVIFQKYASDVTMMVINSKPIFLKSLILIFLKKFGDHQPHVRLMAFGGFFDLPPLLYKMRWSNSPCKIGLNYPGNWFFLN